MTMRKVPRDMRPLARQAYGQGWRLKWLGSTHLGWRSPTGAFVVSSGSPSDRKAVHRLRADLRRAGLVLR
jgi:hypothetical protein